MKKYLHYILIVVGAVIVYQNFLKKPSTDELRDAQRLSLRSPQELKKAVKPKGPKRPDQTIQEAAGNGNFAGLTRLRNKQFDSLNIAGGGRLYNVTVSNAVRIAGMLDAEQCEFGAVHATGKTELEHVTVRDTVDTSGSLELEHVIICGTVRCNGSLEAEHAELAWVFVNTSGGEISFEKSTTETITIKSGESTERDIIVELDGTTVNGNVIFEGKEGIVKLENGAKINGHVLNGQIK